MKPKASTALIAGLCLLAGFAAVQATGLRWVGGVVVLAGAAWCVRREWRHTTAWKLGLVLVLGAACFALAHVLSHAVGPWLAVGVCAAILAAGTLTLVHDQPFAPRNA